MGNTRSDTFRSQTQQARLQNARAAPSAPTPQDAPPEGETVQRLSSKDKKRETQPEEEPEEEFSSKDRKKDSQPEEEEPEEEELTSKEESRPEPQMKGSASTRRGMSMPTGAGAALAAVVVVGFGALIVFLGWRLLTGGTATSPEDEEDGEENANGAGIPLSFTLPTKEPVLPATPTVPSRPDEIPENALVLRVKEYTGFSGETFTFTLPTIPAGGHRVIDGELQVYFAPTEIGTDIKIVWDWDDLESPMEDVSLSNPTSLSHQYPTDEAPKILVLWSQGGSQYFDGWSFLVSSLLEAGGADPEEGDIPEVSAHHVNDIIKLGTSVRFASGAFAFCRNLVNGADSIVSQTPLLVQQTTFDLVDPDSGNTLPDIDLPANEAALFFVASNFNKNISGWFPASAAATVTNMAQMFARNTLFNQAISAWNVSAVTNMHGMFEEATAFNQSLSGWDVSAVTNMSNMFNSATSYRAGLSDPSSTSGFLLFSNGITALQSTINLTNMFGDASGGSVTAVAFGTPLFAAILTYLSGKLSSAPGKTISANLNVLEFDPEYTSIHTSLTTNVSPWTITPPPPPEPAM